MSFEEQNAQKRILNTSDSQREEMVHPPCDYVVGVLFLISARLPKGVQRMLDFIKFVNRAFASSDMDGATSSGFVWTLPPEAEHLQKCAPTKVELFALLMGVTLIDEPNPYYFDTKDSAGKYLCNFNESTNKIMWWCFNKHHSAATTIRPSAVPQTFPVFCTDPDARPMLVTRELLVFAVQKLVESVGGIVHGKTPGSVNVSFEAWQQSAEEMARQTPEYRGYPALAPLDPLSQERSSPSPHCCSRSSSSSPNPAAAPVSTADAAAPEPAICADDDLQRVPSPLPRRFETPRTTSTKRPLGAAAASAAKRPNTN